MPTGRSLAAYAAAKLGLAALPSSSRKLLKEVAREKAREEEQRKLWHSEGQCHGSSGRSRRRRRRRSIKIHQEENWHGIESQVESPWVGTILKHPFEA